MFRSAFGDFEFESSTYLTDWSNYLLWVYWVLVVTINFIVMLNFIIAEVTNSYEVITEQIEPLMSQ